MAEPITISMAALAVAKFVGYSVGTHVIGGEAHHFYREFLERWREAPIDPATGLPRNNDLEQASQQALREAVLLLVMEFAGRIEPEKSWLSRWAQTLPGGGFLTRDIFAGARDPRRKWLEALLAPVNEVLARPQTEQPPSSGE